MGNKPSAVSGKDPSLAKENLFESSLLLSKKSYSPQTTKRKMKYFRKIASSSCERMTSFLRKRRYCLLHFDSSYSDGKLHTLNQLLRTQKSIATLDMQIERFFTKTWPSLKNFRRLDVSGICYDKEDGVKRLKGQINKNLRSLQHLDLHFSLDYNITNPDVSSLIDQIGKNLHSLKFLHLGFSYNYGLNDEKVKVLAEHMGAHLKSLQGLTLDFQMTRISDSGIQSIAEHIGKNLKSLRYLSLDCAYKSIITDIGIQALAECIGNNLPLLQHLELNFLDNCMISKTGIMSLAKQINAHLKSLKHFTFIGAYKQSFSSVDKFMEWFSKQSI